MGKYHLVRRLATGGMAEVYLAKAAGPMGFEKELVVKRILPHLAEDPHFVEMFLTEAKLAARLNHGNVVQIFDFGEQEDSYFIAMEYVDGLNLKTLARRAQQRGVSLPYPLTARIIALACEGLAYAHELVDPETAMPLGFIHRDISPDNILVSMTGGVKVVDFGIAKAANVGQQTQGGVIKGKLAYMPPEYLMGTPIDSRADIYALGVVLYELITGRKPFMADSEAQLAQLIVYQPAVDVRTLRSDVPESLAQVIGRAMSKDREARYASCRQMQADLEQFLFQCGEPVGALQIGELVKSLAAMPEPLARRSSGEIRAVASHATSPSAQATRSLRPPAPTAPQQDLTQNTVVTTPHFARAEDEDTELLRLVARPRWHWLVGIALSVLILGGVAYLAFPHEEGAPVPTPAVSQTADQGPPPASAASQPTSPPGSPEQHASALHDGPAKDSTAPSPQQGSQGEVVLAKEKPAHAPRDKVMLTVTSNLRATVWINDVKVGKTPFSHALSPGVKHIEINGVKDGFRFNKVKSIRLTDDDLTENIRIERVTVTVSGQPSDIRVLTLDGHPLDSQGHITTYEGWHTLKVMQMPSGKSPPAECLAKAGDDQCKVVLNPQ